MKRLLFALPFLFMGTAQAQDSDSDVVCSSIEQLAYSIMEVRQAGVSMAQAMSIAGDNKLAKAIVIDAYKQPRYSTEQVQQREIVDFSTAIAHACYANFRN